MSVNVHNHNIKLYDIIIHLPSNIHDGAEVELLYTSNAATQI